MKMEVNIVGVAAVIFVALLAGAILYYGGGALSNFPFTKSNATTIESFGVVLLVIGVVAVLLLIIIAIIKASKG